MYEYVLIRLHNRAAVCYFLLVYARSSHKENKCTRTGMLYIPIVYQVLEYHVQSSRETRRVETLDKSKCRKIRYDPIEEYFFLFSPKDSRHVVLSLYSNVRDD